MSFVKELLGLGTSAVTAIPDHATVATDAKLRTQFTKHRDASTGLTMWDESSERFNATKKSDQILGEIQHHMDANDKFKEHLDSVLGETGKTDRSIERLVKSMDRKSASQAKSLYAAVDKAVVKHTKAKAALIEESTKLQLELGKKHLEVSTKIEAKIAQMLGAGKVGADTIGTPLVIDGTTFAASTTLDDLKKASADLAENFDNAKSELNKKVNAQLEKHTTTIEEMTSLATKVEEQTGIKRPLKTELKTEAPATGGKASETPAPEAPKVEAAPNKMVESVKAAAGLGLIYDGVTNPNRTGFLQGAEILLGTALTVDGGRKLLRKMPQAAENFHLGA